MHNLHIDAGVVHIHELVLAIVGHVALLVEDILANHVDGRVSQKLFDSSALFIFLVAIGLVVVASYECGGQAKQLQQCYDGMLHVSFFVLKINCKDTK
jgi:hypothetical protein